MIGDIGEFYAMIELLGHDKIAGLCRWVMQGQTCVFLEVQIPGQSEPVFQGIGSIYRVSPCTKEQAELLVESNICSQASTTMLRSLAAAHSIMLNRAKREREEAETTLTAEDRRRLFPDDDGPEAEGRADDIPF